MQCRIRNFFCKNISFRALLHFKEEAVGELDAVERAGLDEEPVPLVGVALQHSLHKIRLKRFMLSNILVSIVFDPEMHKIVTCRNLQGDPALRLFKTSR